jgi:hypothetical protein
MRMPTKNKQADGQVEFPVGCLTRSFTPKSYQEEKDDKGKVQQKIRATFVTENPVDVLDRESWDMIREVLCMRGMVLPENKQVPFFDSHNRWDGCRSMLGSCRNMQDMGDGTGEADAYFSSLPQAQDVATLAREGHLTDLSVGYKVDPKATTWIEPGNRGVVDGKEYDNTGSTKRMAIRTTWYPFEISTTPIGADARTKYREAAIDNPIPQAKERQMPEEKKPDNSAAPASAAVDQEKIRTAAIKEGAEAERARCLEIETAGRDMNIPEEEYRKFITDAIPAAEATRKMIKSAQERLKVAPQGAPDTEVGADETDKFRTAAETALLVRSGYPVSKLDAKLVEGIEKTEFRSGSVLGLAKYCLEKSGVRGAGYMENAQVARLILDASSRATTAQGSADFPYILAAAANKFLMKGYTEAATTYQLWVGTQPLNDFKQNKLVNTTGMSDMNVVKESENPKFGKMADKGEYITLYKIGLAWNLSFEAITNDDKSAFSSVPEKFARSVQRKRNRDAYTFLYGTAGAGPTMNEDGHTLIDTTYHVNLGLSAVPSTSALADARSLLRKIILPKPDKTSVNQYTNASIKHIVAGTKYESAWEVVLNSPTIIATSAMANSQANPMAVNPFAGKGIQLVIDPVIDELTVNGFWAMTDTNEIQHIVLGTLAGEEAPQIRSGPSEIGQARGIVYDVMSIYSFGAVDWRGVIYNAGA